MPSLLVLATELNTFLLVINSKSKECLKAVKVLTDHSYNIHFKITGLELIIERSYQTHSHNIHFKVTGLVRRFSRRRNMYSSRIYFCYIIIGTEFKEKHILEQDELFCFTIISSRLKEKKKCPFLFLENSRSQSPLQEPRTPFFSSGTLDFLSTCLGIDSLKSEAL